MATDRDARTLVFFALEAACVLAVGYALAELVHWALGVAAFGGWCAWQRFRIEYKADQAAAIAAAREAGNRRHSVGSAEDPEVRATQGRTPNYRAPSPPE